MHCGARLRLDALALHHRVDLLPALEVACGEAARCVDHVALRAALQAHVLRSGRLCAFAVEAIPCRHNVALQAGAAAAVAAWYFESIEEM